MESAIGTYRDGKVELDLPVEWESGTRVRVLPEEESSAIREDEPANPEHIRQLLAIIDSFEPLELTPEDEAEIAAARAEVREVSLNAVRMQMAL
jgi:hypothetical protein